MWLSNAVLPSKSKTEFALTVGYIFVILIIIPGAKLGVVNGRKLCSEF